MKFKPGDEATAVYSRLGERYILLMSVTKVGRKYLHGITLHMTSEGIVREGHETKVNIEKSTIYKGLRHDLRKAILKHRTENDQWERQRHKKKNEFGRDFWEYVKAQLNEWEVANPPPKEPDLPTPEVEAK